MNTWFHTPAAIAALTCLAGMALAGGDAGSAACAESHSAPTDPATGRDARRYAPSRQADFTHMKLELTVLDMNNPVMQARQTLSLRAPGRDLAQLSLDARGLTIQSVAAEGRKATHTYDGQTLTITLDPPIPAGESCDLITRYEVRDPIRGLYWTPESAAWPNRPAQLHSQGQPETNSSWFPCHDFPNDKLTTELVVTAPQGFEVLSNGRLAERASRVIDRPNPAGQGDLGGDLTGYDEWRWVQDKPHVPYLVSLVIGKFDVVDVGSPALPMPVYAPPGRGADAKATYARTADMIRFFGSRIGREYPWDKYAQAIVWNFTAGGMENTSATTMYDTAVVDEKSRLDYDLDGLISHELGHQWFGDLVTCRSWEDVWLNEGWATYMTQLWMEHRDGRAAYDAGVRSLFDGVLASDHGRLPETPGMASRVYSDPWEPFRRAANPYGKGASILAMLRAKLGDDAFFKGVALYLHRHQFGGVVSSDFRRALEDASGEALEQFFAQWVYRPDIPRLTVDAAWDDAAKALNLSTRQNQPIDGMNPAYELDLPVWALAQGSSTWTKGVISIRGRDAKASLKLDGPPAALAFDPEQTVAAELACAHPAARAALLITDGPTYAARVQGLRALAAAKDATPETLAAVQALAMDHSQPTPLRVEAVRALAGARDTATLASLASVATREWEVRDAILSALTDACAAGKAGDTTRNQAERLLQRAWDKDPSTHVRATAVRGLARLGSAKAPEIAAAAARTDSQNDDLRSAALDAWTTIGTPDALAAAITLSKPGTLTRTRADAIGRIPRLAGHDRDAAFNALAACINDREQRPRHAAGQALAELKDPRAARPLHDRLAKVSDPSERRMIEGWLAAIETK